MVKQQSQKPLRGVNLGGWLVLERWMTAYLFEGLEAHNEYELVQTEKGKRRLKRHHATFITEDDFKWLSDHAIELVRLPVGHWIFGDKPPYIGAIKRLDWAFEMADKYQIRILLDLHGAPGAQNAADHSGSGRPGLPSWLDDRQKQESTIQVLEKLTARYKDAKQLWGIELVNEPLADRTGLKLAWFYRRAYKRVIRIAQPGIKIIFSDGFKPKLLAGALLFAKKAYPALMDCHFYQCFGDENSGLNFEDHLKKTMRMGWFARFLGFVQPIVVGEWSTILPFHLTPEQTREYWAAQERAYRSCDALIYWNYKTSAPSNWNFRALVDDGVIVLN